MALSGTLSDIGIVELIQFPSNGRKTGELIIAGSDEEARLYYLDGALLHTIVGDRVGMEGLVEIVSWTVGEFEFRMGVESGKKTIDIDLHRALMLALKTRDERAEAARKVDDGKGDSQSGISEKASGILTDLAASNDTISSAYLLSDDGGIVARSNSGATNPSSDFEALLSQIVELFNNYKRPELGRVFLDDDEGILHGARLSSGYIALLATNREASMGVVSMLMNKVVTAMLRIK